MFLCLGHEFHGLGRQRFVEQGAELSYTPLEFAL